MTGLICSPFCLQRELNLTHILSGYATFILNARFKLVAKCGFLCAAARVNIKIVNIILIKSNALKSFIFLIYVDFAFFIELKGS